MWYTLIVSPLQETDVFGVCMGILGNGQGVIWMDAVIRFLKWTAWPMKTWQVYGREHLLTAVFGITGAVLLGVLLALLCKRISRRGAQETASAAVQTTGAAAGEQSLPSGAQEATSAAAPTSKAAVTGEQGLPSGAPDPSRWIYLVTGLLLLLSEIYKQLFNYYIVNGGHYRWDLLPFQLCSLPMYLFLWIPWIRSPRLKLCLNTFLIDFNVMGAVMLFADPSGIFHPYLTLTIHGIFWHLLILAIGVYAGVSGLGAHRHMRGFLYGLPVYAVTCAMAAGINVLVHPYGTANMFYLDPYTPSVQIVFCDIAARYGIFAGNLCYYLAMIVGALVFHGIFFAVGKLTGLNPHASQAGHHHG